MCFKFFCRSLLLAVGRVLFLHGKTQFFEQSPLTNRRRAVTAKNVHVFDGGAAVRKTVEKTRHGRTMYTVDRSRKNRKTGKEQEIKNGIVGTSVSGDRRATVCSVYMTVCL